MGILNPSGPRAGWLVGLILSTGLARGQVITDGTLGAKTALTGPNFEIPASLGRTVGQNLFHSFETLNLAKDDHANFSGPADIANVLTRVTGGTASTINGTLRSTDMPHANFYLVNPAGVVFGPDAKVDVGGAFAVTTADEVRLADGGRFSAGLSKNDVLTAAPPSAFGFLPRANGQAFASVRFEGSQLTEERKSPLRGPVTVAAGAIEITSGANLQVLEGPARLVAVDSPGELPLESVSTTSFERLGNVAIKDDSNVLAPSFEIRADNLTILGSGNHRTGFSKLEALAAGSTHTPLSEIELRGNLDLDYGAIGVGTADESRGGGLRIQAREVNLVPGAIALFSAGSSSSDELSIKADRIQLDSSGGPAAISSGPALSWVSIDPGTGRGADLSLDAGTIEIFEGARITSTTEGTGDGGRISIRADHLVIQGEQTGISSTTEGWRLGSGKAGDVTIGPRDATLELNVSDGGEIVTSTDGYGDGGHLQITASELQMERRGNVRTEVFYLPNPEGETGLGRAGDLDLAVDRIVVDASYISSESDGPGASGNIRIRAQSLTVSGGDDGYATISSGPGLFSQSTSGHGGDLEIQAKDIAVLDGGEISSATSGAAPAGRIRIRADRFELSGPKAGAYISSGASDTGDAKAGDGGDIQIDAREIVLRNGANVSSGTDGRGNAGNIYFTAETLLVDGQGGFATVSSASDSLPDTVGGRAGNIDITAHDLVVQNSGYISTETSGSGPGGNITIHADSLRVGGEGDFASIISGPSFATSGAIGHGGNVTIVAREVAVLNGGEISSATSGSGDAGDVSLTVQKLAVDGSGYYATISSSSSPVIASASGRAGNIEISAQDLTVRNWGLISSDTSGPGAGGNILIQADSLLVDGRGDFAGISSGSSESGAIVSGGPLLGKGGDIRVLAGSVIVRDSGEISSSTLGNGAAGTITIGADSVVIDGANGWASIRSGNDGDTPGAAGSVEIGPREYGLSLVVANGEISSSSLGRADAGSVRLTATQGIWIRDGGEVSVSSESGSAGTVTLLAEGQIRVKRGTVSATAFENGGNIDLQAAVIGLESGRLIANSTQGHGGKIQIRCDLFFKTGNSEISYDSINPSALPGSLTIDAALDLTGSLVVLPGELVDAVAEIREGCAWRNPRANSLSSRSKGGLAETPESFLLPFANWPSP